LGSSGTSWTKQSAPRSRQITTPTPHHSIFTGQMLFLTHSVKARNNNQLNDINQLNLGNLAHMRTEIYTHNNKKELKPNIKVAIQIY